MSSLHELREAMTKPTIWYTDNIHSRKVCLALADGTGFPMRRAVEACDMAGKNPGPSIVYGLLRGCSEIIQRCQAAGEDWWHIDHGYIGRGHYAGHYRITYRGLQTKVLPHGSRSNIPVLPARISYDMKPWREGGKYVVLIPPTLVVDAHYGSAYHWDKPEQHRWVDEIKRSFNKFSEGGHRLCGEYTYELVVSTKDGPRFDELKDAALAVIAHNSIAAVEALMYGIPAYHTHGVLREFCGIWFNDACSCVWGNPGGWVGQDDGGDCGIWGKPDREPFLNWLTHQQFTLDEMRSGEAWTILEKQR